MTVLLSSLRGLNTASLTNSNCGAVRPPALHATLVATRSCSDATNCTAAHDAKALCEENTNTTISLCTVCTDGSSSSNRRQQCTPMATAASCADEQNALQQRMHRCYAHQNTHTTNSRRTMCTECGSSRSDCICFLKSKKCTAAGCDLLRRPGGVLSGPQERGPSCYNGSLHSGTSWRTFRSAHCQHPCIFICRVVVSG